MLRRHVLLVALVVAASALTALAGEAPADAPDLEEALKGFKGFLVGELVKTTDEGIVLLVRAVTLVEGSEAANPGLLLGRETSVTFATKKDDEGRKRPDPALVKTVGRLKDMPAIALGGLGGNAIVIMDAPQQGAGALGGNVRITAQRMTMRINDMDIRLGGDEDEGPAREPKGPTMTARVRADEDGKLVVDRVMPGSTPGHTWAAMPKLQFAKGDEPDLVAEADAAAAVAMKAQQEALKAQARALTKHLAVLKKQLARDDPLPDEQVAQLNRQQDQVLQQLAVLKKQFAQLKEVTVRRKQMAVEKKRRAAEAARKRKPPREAPKETDF